MELSPKQKKAIKLLVGGATKAEVTRQLGLSQRTIYNWLENKTFKKEMDRLQNSIEEYDELLLVKSRNPEAEIENLFSVLLYLANHAKNESVKYNSCCYLLDRYLGKPTAKAETTEIMSKEKDVDIDELLKELDEMKKN